MNALVGFVYRLHGQPDYLLVMGLVFLAVSLTIGGGYLLLAQKGFLKQRLARFLPGGQQRRQVPAESLLVDNGEAGRMQKLSERLLPSGEVERKAGRLKLIRAGFRSRVAYRRYLLLRIISALGLSLVFLLTASFYKLSLAAVAGAISLALLGFFLPELVLRILVSNRQRGISRALPDALDLMVVCAEAGLGLDMTFKRVGEELRPMCRALSDEFQLTIMEIRAGKSRSDSFRAMALRTGVSEVNNLMTILIQASRFGTSIAKALRVHADAMRTKRRQLAEERAAKVAVKLVFPLVAFIFPTLLIVIGGPAFITIFRVLFPALRGGG